MGQTCNKYMFGGAATLGKHCGCCPFCPTKYLRQAREASGVAMGHMVWESCWCCPCRQCCDADRTVGELIVKRQDNPAPYVAHEPTASSDGPLTFADYDARVSASDDNPPYSGKIRANDGGGNNRDHPWMGQAGRPFGQMTYVKEGKTIPSFDPTELVRLYCGPRGDFIPHESDTSAAVPFLAFLVSHDLFRTDAGRGEDGDDVERVYANVNSSYLDLTMIYGYNTKTQHKARTMSDGKLKEDYVVDSRLQQLHPAKAILILFVREHNHVCDELAKRYPTRFGGDGNDEETFQQARLIVIGVYISVIFELYGSCFMGGSGMTPPRQALPSVRGPKFRNPVGFVSSLEFKLLYQWHGIVPEWLMDAMKDTRETTDVEAELKRLVTTHAGHNDIHNTPEWLIPSEVKAVHLARQLRVGSYNDFAEMLGKPRLTSFDQFSEDSEIVAALQKVYDTPDDVEFYIGVRVVPSPKNTNGLFLFHETVSFGILSDAMSAIRHDRFHTTDFTPKVYTKWGYTHARTNGFRDLLKRHTSLPWDIDAAKVQQL